MVDVPLVACSALGEKSPIVSAACCLTALPTGCVIQILAPTNAHDVEALLHDVAGHVAHSVRRVSVDQWFLVGDTPLQDADWKRLNDQLQPRVACVDQSHGRVRLRLEGPKVENVLAKGLAVDLALPNFPVGHATTALIGHIAVHLTRLEETRFDLIVLRSYAESLWDDLARMSAEYI